MAKNVFFIKMAMFLMGKKSLLALNKASKNCYLSQHKTLMDIINYAKNTKYGKEHYFDEINTIEDFQQKVPLNNYEDLKPYISREIKGENNVLVPEKPLRYAVKYNANNNGELQFFPITPKSANECNDKLSKLWFYTMLRENPRMFDGCDLTIVGQLQSGKTPDGTPYGSFSGYLYDTVPKILRPVKVVPSEVYNIKDTYAKYYTLLRFTIPENITFIATGSSLILLEIHEVASSNINDLIKDIRNGTLKKDLNINPEIRKIIESNLFPEPEKADELQKLHEKHGTLLPKHYWPNLALVSIWTTGDSGLYLQNTRGFYPKYTRFREFGYVSPEMRAGIIIENVQRSSILVCHLLFFEFIKKSDILEPNPKVYLASQIEKGELYYIFVTGPNGLYRYNMNTLVRVDGFHHQFPKISFIQQYDVLTPLGAEHLMDALNEVETSKKMKANFYIAFADIATSSYHLFVEFKENYNLTEFEEFFRDMDKTLEKISNEYKTKKGEKSIKHLRLHILSPNSFQHYKALSISQENKNEKNGFKVIHIQNHKDRIDLFKELGIQSGLIHKN